MRLRAIAICMAMVGLATTETAFAVAPQATTGAATDLTATTAVLNATVHPGKETTTFYFEFGTTAAYGSKTTSGTVQGNAAKAVSATLSGLAPSTTYHFRIVASNASGTARGADAQFTTPAPGPVAVTIAATPRIVTFGNAVTITGQVPGNPGVKVVLEQTPFPYTAPFTSVAEGTANPGANYSFTVAPTLNTRYHVEAKASPTLTSGDLTVGVRTKVGLRLSDRTPAIGQRVRFRGSVLPPHDGQAVKIQRRTRAGWKTIATSVLQTATPLDGVPRSKYRKGIRIRRNGIFRTVMPAHGDHARGKSRRRGAIVH